MKGTRKQSKYRVYHVYNLEKGSRLTHGENDYTIGRLLKYVRSSG